MMLGLLLLFAIGHGTLDDIVMLLRAIGVDARCVDRQCEDSIAVYTTRGILSVWVHHGYLHVGVLACGLRSTAADMREEARHLERMLNR